MSFIYRNQQYQNNYSQMTELKDIDSRQGTQNIRKISESQVKIGDTSSPREPSKQGKLLKSSENQNKSISAKAPTVFTFNKHHSQMPKGTNNNQDNQNQPKAQSDKVWVNLTQFASNASTAQLDKIVERDLQVEQRNISWFLRVQNIFIMNGVVSMLYWNCLLSTFDYFSQKYSGYNVQLYFPIPNFFMAMIVAMFFNQLTSRFSYKSMIIVSITMINVCIGLLLIISVVSHQNPKAGFFASVGVCFGLGLFGIIVQLSYCGMINYFSEKTVANFNVGVGASGLFFTLLRIIVTGIYQASEGGKVSYDIPFVPVLIFILICIGLNFSGLWLDLMLFKREIYQVRIVNTQLAAMSQEGSSDATERAVQIDQVQSKKKSFWQGNHVHLSEAQKRSYPRLLWGALKSTAPYPIYIFLNGLFNFMLFPNLTLATKTTLSATWSNLLFLLMFNFGNLMGKIIGGQRRFVNSLTATYIVCCRLFFFYTIPFMDLKIGERDTLLSNDYFPYINQLFFAFSSGLLLNSCFILTFQCAPMRYKKYAGILNGTMYQFGVMLGTFIAVPLSIMVKKVNQ